VKVSVLGNSSGRPGLKLTQEQRIDGLNKNYHRNSFNHNTVIPSKSQTIQAICQSFPQELSGAVSKSRQTLSAIKIVAHMHTYWKTEPSLPSW